MADITLSADSGNAVRMSLASTLRTSTTYPDYTGSYALESFLSTDPTETRTYATAQTTMTQDLTLAPVLVVETENSAGGITITITG